jgi:hypothetical protein
MTGFEMRENVIGEQNINPEPRFIHTDDIHVAQTVVLTRITFLKSQGYVCTAQTKHNACPAQASVIWECTRKNVSLLLYLVKQTRPLSSTI